jgi:hypothetical protein
MVPDPRLVSGGSAYVFPPALVRVVRERLGTRNRVLAGVSDDLLVQLLTTIFFAGLDTHEGEHNPIGVAFTGRSALDLVMSEGARAGAVPLYQWKILRFAAPRPFAARELVKLALAGTTRRMYSAVGLIDSDTLAVTGLARPGVSVGHDPFVTILAPKPGCLSIRSGRHPLLEYERGTILNVGEDQILSVGPVHRALSSIAVSAGVDNGVVAHYVAAVGALVREMATHGRGGILIVSGDEDPQCAESAPYRMVLDSSLAALLRLAWRIDQAGDREAASPRPADRAEARANPASAQNAAYSELLRNAFLVESERVIEELGRMTAIDGAVLLNRDLALIAFGLILPVGRQIAIAEGGATAEGPTRLVDFGSRGTRHRAGATYAAEHPGSVVFVASEDGQISCLLRLRDEMLVRLWRFAEIS